MLIPITKLGGKIVRYFVFQNWIRKEKKAKIDFVELFMCILLTPLFFRFYVEPIIDANMSMVLRILFVTSVVSKKSYRSRFLYIFIDTPKNCPAAFW